MYGSIDDSKVCKIGQSVITLWKDSDRNRLKSFFSRLRENHNNRKLCLSSFFSLLKNGLLYRKLGQTLQREKASISLSWKGNGTVSGLLLSFFCIFQSASVSSDFVMESLQSG